MKMKTLPFIVVMVNRSSIHAKRTPEVRAILVILLPTVRGHAVR